MNDVNSLSHTSWNCKYHIVFAPKYRRKVFYGQKRREIGEILRTLCNWKKVNIIEAEVCPDHIHMLVEIPPKYAVSSFMGYLKGKSIQALLYNPSVLIVDEPTTGLDPEERIRIRNLLFDSSADRTVLFSTHVTEDLAATCNQLAVMKKGHFLYSGNMSELIEQAQGHVWKCRVSNENKAREVEQRYHVSAKQLTSDGLLMKIISSSHPDIECWPCEASLEDAYIYLSNIKT